MCKYVHLSKLHLIYKSSAVSVSTHDDAWVQSLSPNFLISANFQLSISLLSCTANRAEADTNQFSKYCLLISPWNNAFMKSLPVKISDAELSLICHFSIFSCLNSGSSELMFHDVLCGVERGKWWQQSQLQTVRRHTHFPLWAFMWLYIRHSWVLVRPGVFTQRWVLTPGTSCSSRAGASGAARLIGASGRNSEGKTHCTQPPELWISAQGCTLCTPARI